MDSYPQDFPFGIMDVVELLHLRIRRRQANSVYVDCPFCSDQRGKMNVNYVKNVWRCNYCDAHGGMLALYADFHHTTKSDAYREICDSLQLGDTSWGYEKRENENAAKAFEEAVRNGHGGEEVLQSPPASPQEVHQTLSLLFGMLSLTPTHRKHLRSPKRGLTDEQIEDAGFKSTPPQFLCRSLTERLIRQGCTVQGVPGFYMDEKGNWTIRFHSRYAGILIPAVGIDGLIRGAQILLDVPIKDKGETSGKPGTKYLWLSSSSKHMGVTSGSPVHFIGNPFARTIYVTEGLLKADIAHYLMNRSFLGVAGANNVQQLDALFALLAQNGTELIVEAYDMDKYSNEMVAKGSSRIYQMARQNGLECRQLTWNPNYKGVDDWQLALRQKETQKEIPVIQGGVTQAFRLYQLDFDRDTRRFPFAFQDMEMLHKAGHEQPPASDYNLVWEGTILCPAGATEGQILQQIRQAYQTGLPKEFPGRALAASDVVELYDGNIRHYFYVNANDFEMVKFSPFLAGRKRGIEKTER